MQSNYLVLFIVTFNKSVYLFQIEYEKSLKSYHSSAAYQAYIQAKNKGKSGNICWFNHSMYSWNKWFVATAQGTDGDPHERSSSSSKQTVDRRIEIQPAEDEDGIVYRNLLVLEIVFIRFS